MLSNINIGLRHLLDVYPFGFLLIGIAFAWYLGAARARRTRSVGTAAVLLLCGWTVAASLPIAPRYLPYFNELADGPRNGHRWLVDSNLDWGQSLREIGNGISQ